MGHKTFLLGCLMTLRVSLLCILGYNEELKAHSWHRKLCFMGLFVLLDESLDCALAVKN